MSEILPKPETVDRVMQILRRDLMLGPDVAIDEETSLFGGEFELDSLDALLLVTSIEKEFGVKIANKAVGQQIFLNVRSLASYVDQVRSETAADDAGA